MTGLLDQLDVALEEVEGQLLEEFHRMRKTITGEPYSPIDKGVKSALDDVIIDLWNRLENSGDAHEWSIRTERHDEIAFRMIVVKKLLDAKVPTAFLEESHDEAEEYRRKHKVAVKHAATEPDPEPVKEKKGLFGFRKKSTSVDVKPKAEPKKVEVYAEGSVYSAAQELASISRRFSTGGDEREMMNKVAAGGKAKFESRELSAKALAELDAEQGKKKRNVTGQYSGPSSFESRDLSSTPPVAREEPAGNKIARSPDEIRRKLEQAKSRSSGSTGASKFAAKDLSSSISPTEAVPAVKEKRAQSPEEIRRKLQARSNQSAGKASFAAKDIESESERASARQADEKPATKPGGRAVFESKDLSDTPPGKR